MSFVSSRVWAVPFCTSMIAGTALAQPVLSSISRAAAPLSGRIVLRGSGFGDRTQGIVEIGGVRAHVATWNSTTISAYIPESVPLGAAGVQVRTGAGVSAVRQVTVQSRVLGDPVAWLFETDGGAVRQRGVVSPEGVAYFHDDLGFLYAVDSTGGLQWIYCADCDIGFAAEGPVSRAEDGTIFVGGNPGGPETNIHAVNPDGSRRWRFVGLNTSLIAGPNVGPDGNVYFVHENIGMGLVSLDPQDGSVNWAVHPPQRAFLEFGEVGEEIVFGRTQPSGEVNRIYTMFDMRPLQPGIPDGAIGTLFSHSLDGSMNWEHYTGAQEIAGGQIQGQAATGPDGTVYYSALRPPNAWALYASRPSDGSNLWNLYIPPGNTMTPPSVAPDGTILVVRNTINLHAVNPSGSVRWTYVEPNGSFREGPVTSPAGGVIIAGGTRGDTETFSAHVRAVTSSGTSLWSVFIPREPNGSGGTNGFVVSTRAFFAPDSSRAYVGLSMAGQSTNTHSYVVSLVTGENCRPLVQGGPSTVQVCPSGSTSISMNISGNGPANIQWQWRPEGTTAWIDVIAGVNTDPTQAGVPSFMASGASLPTLDLMPAGMLWSDSGARREFRALASNACGSAFTTSTSLAECIGDQDCSDGTDGDDVIAFFANWDQSLTAADVNQDGGVDGDDVIRFFERWDEGC